MLMSENMILPIQPKQPKFCYLFIDFQPEAYVGFGTIFLTLIFLVISLTQLWRTKISRKLNFNIRLIYLSILAFPLFYLSKIILSEYVFWNSYQTEKDQQSSNFNSFLSKYMFLSQFLEFFFFEMMILMVSYNWIGNIIQIFQYMLGQQESKIYIKKEKIVLKIIKFCLIIRIIELSLIIPFFLLENPIVIAKMYLFVNKSVVCVWVLQELFMAIIFILDVYLIKKNDKLRQLLEDEDRTDMIKNYGFLATLIIPRFIWSIFFAYGMLSDNKNFNEQFCQIISHTGDEIFQSIFLLVKALLIYLMLFMVLRIFKIKQQRISTDSYYQMNASQN